MGGLVVGSCSVVCAGGRSEGSDVKFVMGLVQNGADLFLILSTPMSHVSSRHFWESVCDGSGLVGSLTLVLVWIVNHDRLVTSMMKSAISNYIGWIQIILAELQGFWCAFASQPLKSPTKHTR